MAWPCVALYGVRQATPPEEPNAIRQQKTRAGDAELASCWRFAQIAPEMAKPVPFMVEPPATENQHLERRQRGDGWCGAG